MQCNLSGLPLRVRGFESAPMCAPAGRPPNWLSARPGRCHRQPYLRNSALRPKSEPEELGKPRPEQKTSTLDTSPRLYSSTDGLAAIRLRSCC